MSDLPTRNLQLQSTVTRAGQLQLTLADVGVAAPGENEVVVRVEAAPINPSDLGLLLGMADVSSAVSNGDAGQPTLTADIPAGLLKHLGGRLDQPMPVGNEGAGTVVAAGASAAAQAMLGRTVGVLGGAMYTQYRTLNVHQCLLMNEGVTAAEAIAQELGNKDVHPHPLDRRNIPGCTYCHPQIASVGLTEAKAREAGYEVKIGNFPFIGNGKAIALGEAEGFVKTVFDAKTGELLGAHMIGAEVTELIQGYVVGKQLETTEAELMQAVFPHPTLSEMMHESVLAAYGRALHI